MKKNKIIYLISLCFVFSPFSLQSNSLQDSSGESLFLQADKLLQDSNAHQQESRSLILKANGIRKQINQLRAKARKNKDPIVKKEMLAKANKLALLLEKQQLSGASFRSQSLLLRQESVAKFSDGLAWLFADWLTNKGPLTMDKKALEFIAHNAKLRSVHPTMLNKMGTTQDDKASLEKAKTDMTLLVPALMAQKAPPDLDINAFQLSHKQNYVAHIEVQSANTESGKNVSQVPLNQMHQWRLMISDRKGNPVKNANIEVLGHMPGHVHGLPTQPIVTRELDDGVYLVEGVKFQMQGWWVIQFDMISAPIDEKKSQGSLLDSLTFNLIL